MAFAKTTRPTLAGTVERSRLFRLLDRAGRQPVTWVWAPAGSGKTTLVASYLTNRRVRPLWYRIDEGDADVATFFYYLGRAAPRRRRSLPLLTPEYRQGLAAFTRRFFRDLYSRLGRTSTVVFDNYQDVPPDSALHGVMVEALEEIPKGGRVIVISRSEPPGSFARLRAHQRIKTLDWSHVRFTLAEATALVRKLVPGRWSPATIRALYTTADGWCAGLVLLFQHLRSEGRNAAALTAVSPDVLFDYFADEIFKKADPLIQDVLLQTAFLPGVTPSMAIALTGRHDAGEILARLHHQNYFTNKQSGTEATYTYHPLFREFLLSRAGRAYPQARRTKLRRVAASLLDGAGQIEAASRLLREAEDWEGLAQMVYRHASTLLVQGRAQTVEDWLTDMPALIIEDQPWLAFWRAIGVFGQTECQRDLQQAFHSFRRHGDALGMFQAWSAIIFAYETVGESVPMDRWIALLDDIMQATPGFPSKGAETRVAGAMLGAISMRQPHHPDGTRWAERAIELVRSHPDPSIRAIIVWNWIHFELQRGDLSKVAAMIDELRVFLPTQDASPVFAVNASATVAWYEALMGLRSYRRTVSDMLELAHATGLLYNSRHIGLGAGIVGALSDGAVDMAAAWLRELERDFHLLGPIFRFWHRWFLVWEALLRNDVARATSHQPEMLRLAFASGRPLDEAVAHLMAAQVFHTRGDARESRAQLDCALGIAHAIPSPFLEFMARLIEAQVCFDGDRESEGLAALRRAMALGQERSYVNSLVWIPAVMARLCVRALAAGIEVEYVRGLVRTRGLVPDNPPLDVEAWPWPIEVFTLGRFEVRRGGQPVRFTRKVQRKPLALLKALITFSGHAVPEDRVIDTLWPDAEGDAARVALGSALHRLRGLLGSEQAVVRQEGQLSLDARICWVDIWAVDHLLRRAEAAGGSKSAVRKAAELYRGAFLEGQALDLPAAAGLADTLRRRLLRAIVRLAQQCEESDQQEAADWYEQALRVEPRAEDVYRRLMNVYSRLGRSADAVETYRRCRAAVADHLGAKPAPETEALLQAVRLR